MKDVNYTTSTHSNVGQSFSHNSEMTNMNQMKDIETPLAEIISDERINLGLQKIDHNLMELTAKLRKPKEQVEYVAQNWRQWKHNAFLIAVTVAGLWLTKKVIQKF